MPDHISTREELNQWEAANIERAERWLESRRSFDVLTVDSLRELHHRMFNETWKWAGEFRRSDNQISPYNWPQVPLLMRDLVENTRTQYEASGKTDRELDEIVARFHHQLVRVHPWPNGNGRHAREAADQLLREWERPPFSWGGGNLERTGEAKAAYVAALRAADNGDFNNLIAFVRT